MFFKRITKKIFNKAGFDIVRYPPMNQIIKRRMKLISFYDINLIFDVGANIGQYAKQMRNRGYKGRIVSFEPLSSAYKKLVENSSADPLWNTVNIALGDNERTTEINIAGNSYSSSILDMLPKHLSSAPDSVYVGKKVVIVRRIDSIISDYFHSSDKLFLKIDTQGYEKNVIDGAENSIDKIAGIQLEMSLVPLYKGETLFLEIINLLKQKGYTLMSLEPGFSDPSTEQLLQVDGIFFRQV